MHSRSKGRPIPEPTWSLAIDRHRTSPLGYDPLVFDDGSIALIVAFDTLLLAGATVAGLLYNGPRSPSGLYISRT